MFPVPTSAESKGLAVVGQDAKGFTIQELGGGTGSYDVDYRVVATVKGHENTRMEQLDPPTMPTPPAVPATPPGPATAPPDQKERP